MKKIKRYTVTDEDGSKYAIEEELDEVVEDEEVEVTEEVKDDEATLTADEISALKRLAAVADKLLAKAETTDEDPEVEEEIDEVVEDEEEEEEILDTDEDIETTTKKTSDSKKSFGSIGVKKSAKDSMASATSIEDAWKKRYGG